MTTALRQPVEVTLTVADGVVRLTGPGVEVSGSHLGVRPGLAAAVDELRSARVRCGVTQRGTRPVAVKDLAVDRTAGLLADSFLPPEVGQALAELIRAATAGNVAVHLGVQACGGLARLPWEALREPDSGRPLALHPRVNVYRKVTAVDPLPTAGPLRILIAIAAPDEGGGARLDYQRELRSVLQAVRTARHADARIRIVPFGSTEAIRTELLREPVHVLHVSSHGSPGKLHLEDAQGNARAVSADEFVDEAIPSGHMPAVIALAACHTDVAGGGDDVSLAAALCARGASAVIATQTSITDRYSTWFFARVYAELVATPIPDVVTAVAEARRRVQNNLSESGNPVDRQIAALDEWATVTILAAQGSVPIFDPQAPRQPRSEEAAQQTSIAGLLHRPVGGFVGRRTEQRRWPAELAGTGVSGMVLHGIGGIGKTTLAAELVDRLQAGPDRWVIASLTGQVTVDDVLAKVSIALRQHLTAAGQVAGMPWQVAEALSRMDTPWQERLTQLQEYLFDRLPLLLVLDNFEDNLTSIAPGGWEVTDPALTGLLTGWAQQPGRSRMLLTCRYPFTLPGHVHHMLVAHQLGPLTFPETLHLMFALPALDVLELDQLERVWRLLGGHPRSLEYLDAILSGGRGRYPDITARLAAKHITTLDPEQQRMLTVDESTLDASLAQVATIAADEVLLDELIVRLRQTPDAMALLLGASVYREPVDRNALRGPAKLDALVEACVVSSLLTHDEANGHVFVHRWTATELHRRWLAAGHADQINAAHQRAAGYWLWRFDVRPQGHRDQVHSLLEARHHLLQAGDLEQADQVTRGTVSQLAVWGAWDQAHTLTSDMLTRLPERHLGRGVHVYQLGVLAQYRGDYAEAERRYQQALKLAEESGNRDGVAASHHHLGGLAQSCGDYTKAERRYQQSLTIKIESGNRVGLARTYTHLGILARSRGDYTKAEHYLQQALTIFEEFGDRDGIAHVLHNLGIEAHDRGDHTKAERYYWQALTMREKRGNRSGMVDGHHQLGALALLREDYAEAERHFRQALTIVEVLGDRAAIAATYQRLGMLTQRRGDQAEAERRYRQALTIAEELGIQSGMADNHHQLGVLAQERGEYAEAERRYRHTLTITEKLGDPVGMATSNHNLGTLAQLRGDHAEAERRYQQALTINEERGNHADMAIGYSHLGNLAEEAQRISEAAVWHLKAFAIRAHIGAAEGVYNLGRLRSYRCDLGPQVFDRLATETVGDFASTIIDGLESLGEPRG